MAGGTTLVTNAGSNGKFLGVLDLEIAKGRVSDARSGCFPCSRIAETGSSMPALIEKIRAPHAADYARQDRDRRSLLYRRGNFSGTVTIDLRCVARPNSTPRSPCRLVFAGV